MKRQAFLLLVIFILIMTLAGGCVQSPPAEPSRPATNAALLEISLDDPQELERFLDAPIAEGTVE